MERIRDLWRRAWPGERQGGGGPRLEGLLLEHYPGSVLLLDEFGVVLEVNPGFERHAGHPAAAVIGRRVGMLDLDPLHGEFVGAVTTAIATGRPWQGVVSCRRADGTLIHQATTLEPVDSPLGRRLLVVQRDVTEICEPGQRDHERLAGLESLYARVPGVLFRLRQDTAGRFAFLYLSEGMAQLPGLDPQAIKGDAEILLERVVEEDHDALVASLAQSAISLEPWRLEFRLRLTPGIRWVEGRALPQRRDDGEVLWDGLLIEVSERKQLESQVQRLVSTDMLTGALNRRAFFEQGEAALARARRQGVSLPVAMLDIDRFKVLNDTHGHAVGDIALQSFAATCRDCLRAYDLFARIGGEEFVVVLVDTGPEEAWGILERLRQAVAKIRLEVEGGQVGFTVSLGLAILPSDGSLEAVLTQADRALYRAKRSGRNRICGPPDLEEGQAEPP